MSNPQLMDSVDDGLIVGHIETRRKVCAHCGHTTRCIRVGKIMDDELRQWVKESPNKFIFGKVLVNKLQVDLDAMIGSYVGIGCGCYGKAHRQVAHVKEAMR
jgi:hypothetical protein